MDVVDLVGQPKRLKEQAAAMLVESFTVGWPTYESACEEVERVMRDGFTCAMLDQDLLLGWVGGLPEYDGRVWELHPIVVRREYRRQGIGRKLVEAFEKEAACRGALTVTLGTDDDSGITSLAGVNLYDNLPHHISEIQDLGHKHPFLFYQKLGFVVTGVMPDANGHGLPDIYMSKAIRPANCKHNDD